MPTALPPALPSSVRRRRRPPLRAGTSRPAALPELAAHAAVVADALSSLPTAGGALLADAAATVHQAAHALSPVVGDVASATAAKAGIAAATGGAAPPDAPGALTPAAAKAVADARGVITLGLGEDLLLTLLCFVFITPVSKRFGVSPVLGYLAAGLALRQAGLFSDFEEVEKLGDLGVIFLLFEMGLELNLDRLATLGRYALGIGLPQVLGTAGVFTLLGRSGLVTDVLEILERERGALSGLDAASIASAVASDDRIYQIRTLDEALVIGGALALSSSAFVLQLMGEAGTLGTRYGAGALGVLLMQDIAVVPLLVLLPLIEAAGGLSTDAGSAGLLTSAAPQAALALGGLGAVVLFLRFPLKVVFDFVAETRSNDAFIGLCLLTVAGTSFATKELGFSDTMGAFLAGVLLAESNYLVQIEADIKPFKGILLGLFFLCVGATVDLTVLAAQWPSIGALLVGLLATKFLILAPVGRAAGLSWADAVRVGVLLSQGGEFAFVLLNEAQDLGVLPVGLNEVLIIVVVASMALTPALAELAETAGGAVEAWQERRERAAGEGGEEGAARREREDRAREASELDDLATLANPTSKRTGLTAVETQAVVRSRVVVVGLSPMGLVVCAMLSSPLSGVLLNDRDLASFDLDEWAQRSRGGRDGGRARSGLGVPFAAFDHDPTRVRAARLAGFDNAVYGQPDDPGFLSTFGIESPESIVVAHADPARAEHCVASLRSQFPLAVILAAAPSVGVAARLRVAGADEVVTATTDVGLELGRQTLLKAGLGSRPAMELVRVMRNAVELRTGEVEAALARAERRALGDGGGGGGGVDAGAGVAEPQRLRTPPRMSEGAEAARDATQADLARLRGAGRPLADTLRGALAGATGRGGRGGAEPGSGGSGADVANPKQQESFESMLRGATRETVVRKRQADADAGRAPSAAEAFEELLRSTARGGARPGAGGASGGGQVAGAATADEVLEAAAVASASQSVDAVFEDMLRAAARPASGGGDGADGAGRGADAPDDVSDTTGGGRWGADGDSARDAIEMAALAADLSSPEEALLQARRRASRAARRAAGERGSGSSGSDDERGGAPNASAALLSSVDETLAGGVDRLRSGRGRAGLGARVAQGPSVMLPAAAREDAARRASAREAARASRPAEGDSAGSGVEDDFEAMLRGAAKRPGRGE